MSGKLAENDELAEEEVDDEQCTICLQPIVDRTVVPTCSHEFCFECLMVWSGACLLTSGDVLAADALPQDNPDDARYALKTLETISSTASVPHTITRNTSSPPSVRPLALSPASMERVLLPRTDAVNARGAHANALRKTRQTHSNARSVVAGGYTNTTSTRRYAPSVGYCAPCPLNVIVSTLHRTNIRVTARTQPRHSSRHRRTSSVA